MRWLPLLLIVLLAVAAALRLGRRPLDAGAALGPGPSGVALYARHCARCHAEGGSDRAATLDLRGGTWSDEALRRVIVQGKGRMPPVPLRGAALDSLVRYVQSGS